MTITGDTSQADLARANAEADQFIASRALSEKPDVSPEREAELDKAFKEVTGQQPPAGELGRENAGVVPHVDGTPDPAKAAKPAEAPAPEEVEKAPAVQPIPKPQPTDPSPDGRKGLLDDLLDKPAEKPVDKAAEAFDSVKLRSDASPRTQETFNNLKAIAQAQIAEERTKREEVENARAELQKQIEELQKSVGKLTPEVETELKELREYRALHDVSSRPEFREKFDTKVEANLKECYALFKEEGMTDSAIATLAKMEENARADYIESKVLPNLSTAQRRFVEAKLLDNVNISGEKAKALDAARAEAEKILGEQKLAPQKQEEERVATLAAHLRKTLVRLPFFHTKEAPTTATESEKAEIEAYNKTALELQATIKAALLDNSPEGRAESVLAVPLAKYFRQQHAAALARAEKAEAELKAIQKAAGTGRRLGQSAAPAPAGGPPQKQSLSEDSGDAIDKLFAEAQNAQR
jgi:hypothetical protein